MREDIYIFFVKILPPVMERLMGFCLPPKKNTKSVELIFHSGKKKIPKRLSIFSWNCLDFLATVLVRSHPPSLTPMPVSGTPRVHRDSSTKLEITPTLYTPLCPFGPCSSSNGGKRFYKMTVHNVMYTVAAQLGKKPK